MKLRQGNVFTPVCHSVHRGGVGVCLGSWQTPTHPMADTLLGKHPLGRHPPGQTPPWANTPWADTLLGRHPPGQTPPAQCMLGYIPLSSACWNMVIKQAVRILLEYILVQRSNRVNFEAKCPRQEKVLVYV